MTITLYDGLGRLVQTTDDDGVAPTDETGGVKTQTRYRNTSAGSYTAVSNPYRNLSNTGETTVGWTVSQSDATGRAVGTTFYTGSDLPTVFGGGGGTDQTY